VVVRGVPKRRVSNCIAGTESKRPSFSDAGQFRPFLKAESLEHVEKGACCRSLGKLLTAVPPTSSVMTRALGRGVVLSLASFLFEMEAVFCCATVTTQRDESHCSVPNYRFR